MAKQDYKTTRNYNISQPYGGGKDQDKNITLEDYKKLIVTNSTEDFKLKGKSNVRYLETQ
jgi:hypothetical protein